MNDDYRILRSGASHDPAHAVSPPRETSASSRIPYRAREGVPTPAGAERVNAFEIYRYTLTPTITRRDTFEVDLDDCARWF